MGQGFDKAMAIYMFGQRVSVQERDFLTKVLSKSNSRLEQGKQFKAIYKTAKRHNTSLQNAALILENNNKKAAELNSVGSKNGYYTTDKNGILCKKYTDGSGAIRIYQNTAEIHNIKNDKNSFSGIFNKIKQGLSYIKSLFIVY